MKCPNKSEAGYKKLVDLYGERAAMIATTVNDDKVPTTDIIDGLIAKKEKAVINSIFNHNPGKFYSWDASLNLKKKIDLYNKLYDANVEIVSKKDIGGDSYNILLGGKLGIQVADTSKLEATDSIHMVEGNQYEFDGNIYPTYGDAQNAYLKDTLMASKLDPFSVNLPNELKISNFTPADIAHIANIVSTNLLIATKVLTKEGKEVTANSLKQWVYSRWTSKLSKLHDPSNTKIAEFNNAVTIELGSYNSKLWNIALQKFADNFNYSIDYYEVEARDEDDLTKGFDEDASVKLNINESINKRVSEWVATLQYDDTNTPTGIAEYVSFKDISPRLAEITKGCLTLADIMNELNSYSKVDGGPKVKIYGKIANELSTKPDDFKNLFAKHFNLDNRSSLYTMYKTKELVDNQTGEKYFIPVFDTDLANRESSSTINSYDAIIDKIQSNAEMGKYSTPEFQLTWTKAKNESDTMIAKDKENLYEAISKMWNVLGIDIPFDILKQHVNNNIIANDRDKAYDDIKKDFYTNLNLIKGSDTNEGWIDGFNNKTITKSLRVANSGDIFRVANVIGKYTSTPILSYTSVTGNLMFTTQQTSFLNKWFTKLRGVNKGIAETHVKELTNCPANNSLFLLWGNEIDAKTGDVLVKGNGIANYIKVGDNKVYHSLNNDFIDNFDYNHLSGIKNEEGESKEFSGFNNTDYVPFAVLNYFVDGGYKASKSDWGYIPIFVLSDRGRTMMIRVPKLNLKGNVYSKFAQDINNKSKDIVVPTKIHNLFYDLVLGEVAKIRTAIDVIFEPGKLDLDSQPVLRESVTNGTVKPQLYHHTHGYNEDGKVTINDIFKKTLPSGYSFTTIKALQDIPELFDHNGLLRSDINFANYEANTKANKALLDEVNKVVDSFIVNTLVENKAVIEEYREDINSMFDKANTKVIQNWSTDINEFIIADYLARHSYYSMFEGTMDNFKTMIELNKRAGMVMSLGQQNMNFDYIPTENGLEYTGTFTSVTVADNKVMSPVISNISNIVKNNIIKNNPSYSEYSFDSNNLIKHSEDKKVVLNPLEKRVFDQLGPYFDVNTTDAFSVITIEEFEHRIKGYGLYTKYKDAIEAYKNNSLDANELNNFIELQKNIYYGYEYDKSLNKMMSRSIKNAEFVISPKIVAGTELESLYNAMVESKVSQVNFVSATKTGVTSVVNIFDDKGLISDNNLLVSRLKSGKVEYRYENLMMQQEYVTHMQDSKSTMSVPLQKKIITNLSKKAIYAIKGFSKKLTGPEFSAIWNHLLSAEANAQSKDVLKDLKFNGTNDEKYNAIIDIINEAASTDTNLAEIAEYVNYIKENGNSDSIRGYINFVLSSSKIENLITSRFNNRVATRKLSGFHSPVVSNSLSKKTLATKESTISLSNVVELDSKYRLKYPNAKADGKLNYMVLEEGENKTYIAECYVPAYYSNFIKTNGTIDINKIAEEAPSLLNLVGIRIPTEDKHSMFVVKVIGFLPADAGSGIVLPDEMVAQLGQDFDFDSVYMYAREFNIVNGKYEVPYHSHPDANELDSKGRNNAIVDMMESVLLNPEHYAEISTPSGFPHTQAISNMIRSLTSKSTITDPYSFKGNASFRDTNIQGRDLKGKSVSWDNFVVIGQNSNISVSEDYALTYKLDYSTTPYNKEELARMYPNMMDKGSYAIITESKIGANPSGGYYNAKGEMITSYTAETTSHILDIVKNPLVPNVNNFTFGVWKYLTQYNIEYASLFVNQPIISKIIDIKNKTDKLTSDKTYNDRELVELAIKTIDPQFDIKEYKEEVVLFSEKELLDNITTPDSQVKQIAIAMQFLKYLRLASNVNDLIAQLRIDKNGTGVDINKSLDLKEAIDLEDTDIFSIDNKGVLDAIYKGNAYPYFKKLKELVLDNSYEYINPLFIRYSTAVSNFTNALVKISSSKDKSKIAKKASSFVNNHIMKTASFLNNSSADKARIVGVNNVISLTEIDLNAEMPVEYHQLSAATKLNLVKDAIVKYNKTSTDKLTISLLDSLKGQITKDDYVRNGYHHVKLYNTDSIVEFKNDFNTLYYNENPYLKDLARDLIRYEFIVNGFNFGFSGISKFISPNILVFNPTTSDYDNGTGILDHYSNAINTTNDIINLNELFERYMQNNYKDDSVVKDITGKLNTTKDKGIKELPNGYKITPDSRLFKNISKRQYVKTVTGTKDSTKTTLYKIVLTDTNVVLLAIPTLMGNEHDWKSINPKNNPSWVKNADSIEDAVFKIQTKNSLNLKDDENSISFIPVPDNSLSNRRRIAAHNADISIVISNEKHIVNDFGINDTILTVNDFIKTPYIPEIDDNGTYYITGSTKEDLTSLSNADKIAISENVKKMINLLADAGVKDLISDGQSGISELVTTLWAKMVPNHNINILVTPDYHVSTGVKGKDAFEGRYKGLLKSELESETPVEEVKDPSFDRALTNSHKFIVNRANDLHKFGLNYADSKAGNTAKILDNAAALNYVDDVLIYHALKANHSYVNGLIHPEGEFNIIDQLEAYLNSDLTDIDDVLLQTLRKFKNRLSNIILQGERLTDLEYVSSDSGLNDSDKLINDAIKDNVNLIGDIKNIQTKYNKFLEKYFKATMARVETHPYRLQEIIDIFDVEDDESIKQLYLDAMANTNSGFMANIVAEYVIEKDKFKQEAAAKRKDFEKIVAKEFNLKSINDVYNLTENDWAKFLDVVDGKRVARVLLKYDYEKYNKEKSEYGKELREKYKLAYGSFAYNSKMNAWEKAHSSAVFDEKEVRKIIKENRETLSSEDFDKWRSEHIKEKNNKPVYTPGLTIEPNDNYIKAEFKALNPNYKNGEYNELYSWLFNNLPSMVGDSLSPKNPITKHMLPTVTKAEQHNLLYDATHIKEWYESQLAKPASIFEGANGKIIHKLDFKLAKLLSNKKPIIITKRDGEAYGAFITRSLKEAKDAGFDFKTYQDLLDHNNNIRKEQLAEHTEKVETNLSVVIPSFIDGLYDYKFKKEFKDHIEAAEYFYGDVMQVHKTTSAGELINRAIKHETADINMTAAMPGKTSNTFKHFKEWTDAVFYGEFDIDEGHWTAISKILQKYSSYKFMWLNAAGAVNNVAVGKIQMALETASWSIDGKGYFVDRKDILKADKTYFGAISDFIANSNNRTASTLEGALIKEMDIMESQDEKDYAVKQLHKRLLSSNSLFILQHLGEHYMQNTMLFAMMNSHRNVNGEIMSFVDYKRNNNIEEKALTEILTADELVKYEAYKAVAIERIQKRVSKVDYVTDFIRTLGTDRMNTFIKKRAEVEDILHKEFELHMSVMDMYELKDGFAVIKDGVNVNNNEIASFKDKVIKVNQKVHGIYNKQDASIIQRRAMGKLAMQFKKHIIPAWNKRFGSKMFKSFWNTPRQEWDKGAYTSFLEFAVFSPYKAGKDAARQNESSALREIMKAYRDFVLNLRTNFKVLDDFERANVSRTLQEFAFLITLITMGYILRHVMGAPDDDDDEVFNAILYQQDRLMQEMYANHIGLIGQGQQIIKSPVASFKAASQLLKAANTLVHYPFMDEQDKIIKGGTYHGEDKLKVYGLAGIPIGSQILKIQSFDKTNKYFALFRPIDESKEKDK